MSTDEAKETEVAENPHADCAPPIWSGTVWECRNHNPFVEVPQLRTPTKRLASPPQLGAKARRQGRPPTGAPPPEATRPVELQVFKAVSALGEEVERFHEESKGLYKSLEKIAAQIEPLPSMDARLAGLEEQSKLYFAYVQEHISHLQRIGGRLIKLEHWANGSGEIPPVVASLTPESEKPTGVLQAVPGVGDDALETGAAELRGDDDT